MAFELPGRPLGLNFEYRHGPFNVFQDIVAHQLTRFELSKMLITQIKTEQFSAKMLKEKGTQCFGSNFYQMPQEIIDLILKHTY